MAFSDGSVEVSGNGVVAGSDRVVGGASVVEGSVEGEGEEQLAEKILMEEAATSESEILAQSPIGTTGSETGEESEQSAEPYKVPVTV